MGISAGSLLIILAIVLLLFGNKRLRLFGSDVAAGIREFCKALRENSDNDNSLKGEKHTISDRGKDTGEN